MKKIKQLLWEFLMVLALTTPSFWVLRANRYFTMHDNQHVARLFLLDKGIRQGYLYPRWVDTLTFGFGDPLFNFYPPLVYYLAELFHLLGFSLITSTLLVFGLGFILAAWGMYLFAKDFLGRWGGLLASTLYTYFFYHAVNAYVRGALAEFFTMSVIPFILYCLTKLWRRPTVKDTIYFAVSFAFLIITHQLIALPFVIFLMFFALFLLSQSKKKASYLKHLIFGSLLGLGLSAFFWLPALIERKYTFLGEELGGYKLHYIFPQQFWYSPWGFGGSVAGLADGMTFQLGKIPIVLIALSFFLFLIYILTKKKFDKDAQFYLFFVFLLVFGIFMTTPYSSFIWDNVTLLWNLQFPWRFMAVTSVFVSLIAAYTIFFLIRVVSNWKLQKFLIPFLAVLISLGVVVRYSKYFQPQRFTKTSDRSLTTFYDIAWRQSKTVLHFVPKGVRTKKIEYGISILDIEKKGLPQKPFEIKEGEAIVKILENRYQNKKFEITAAVPSIFQLNTFNFIGWSAYLDGERTFIADNNQYKLITVQVPQGKHQLEFVFENTLPRNIGNALSTLSTLGSLVLLKLH